MVEMDQEGNRTMNGWDGQAGPISPKKRVRVKELVLDILTLIEDEIGSDKSGIFRIEFSMDPTNPTVSTHVLEISKL